MAKEIVYDVDARERLREGADALANAVKVTLGPKVVTWLSTKSSVLPVLPRTV